MATKKNVAVGNRSEMIRQVFLKLGDVYSSTILDHLAGQGVECSVTLVDSVRKKMKMAGLMPVKKATTKSAAPAKKAAKGPAKKAAKPTLLNAEKFWTDESGCLFFATLDGKEFKVSFEDSVELAEVVEQIVQEDAAHHD